MRNAGLILIQRQHNGWSKVSPNMKSNLKVILSAAGVAALLASPAMAKSPAQHHNTVHHYAAPARAYVPSSAYGYTPPNQYPVTNWCAAHPYSWDACHDPRENWSN